MNVTRRALVLALVSLAALVAIAAAFAQDEDGDKVVFTVGVPEDYDTLNPLVGVEVPDFDVWNLQYATLTDKAATDFATIPGLAESWKASNGGRTYTYTLRDGLEWSDGTPLTAEDVVFNVNRGREEEWLNHYSTVQNLTAKAIDDRTVEITSSVPDPKLPTMDVYIVPKHVWGKFDAKAITKFNGITPVGSGPFTLEQAKRGQFWSMQANPNYWGWDGEDPPIDEVVFRSFNNPDAMVAALKQGEIDAAHDVPANSVEDLRATPGIVVVQGQQGGFDELAINGGGGSKDGFPKAPHPALLDPEVRLAIAHSIDKKTLVDRVLVGLGTVGSTVSPSASPEWIPEVPAGDLVAFDLAQAKKILDDAGYEDTNGDGVREMPGGGRPLDLRYMVRTESQTDGPVSEFVSGWLKEIGIKTTLVPINESKLTQVIGEGTYDLFTWGWTPYVDPDQMLSYFQCSQISADPDDPDELLERRQLVRPRLRQALQAAERGARQDEARRPRAPDAQAHVRLERLQRALVRGRPAGLPDGSVRRLAAPAGRDRAGDLLELVTHLREPDPGRGDGGWRRRRHLDGSDRGHRRRRAGGGRSHRLLRDPEALGGRARVTARRRRGR